MPNTAFKLVQARTM